MNIDDLKNFKNPPQSFWIGSTESNRFPTLDEDINTDIVIIGGGITGITSAYLLQKEGLKVAVLEASSIAHGTTGHTTAKITSQHELIYDKLRTSMGPELAQQYATANQTAIREIKKVIDELSIQCDYIPQSAYVYTENDSLIEKIQYEVDAATRSGIKATYLDKIPLPFPVKAAIRFDDQAQFHPLKYVLALAQEFTKQGGQIFEQCRAVEVEESSPYVITTNNGKKVTAEKMIIASHYPFYNKKGMYFTRIYAEKSYVLAIKSKDKYPGGMYINAEEPARSFRSQDSEFGELILVGGDQHKTGQGGDTRKHYENLVDYANGIFSLESIPFRWSTQDCMTLDGVPYVGNFTKDTPNMYIATGFGKWGMTNSMASAMLLRDLIVKGESPWKDVYNPSRSTVGASAVEFVVENFNVAGQLIGGKVEPVPKEVVLKPGEGKIVEIEGKRAGAYRDENGDVYIVNTTCTHMGCELNWNAAERTWDCPCHGSRFNYDGTIVEGPAVHEPTMDEDVNTIKKLITEDF
jgi:glycine/D-amino acid oxidase-like deaminating enzyme/nitrite reductase/ring-hydroxylating ferredoxin subunit